MENDKKPWEVAAEAAAFPIKEEASVQKTTPKSNGATIAVGKPWEIALEASRSVPVTSRAPAPSTPTKTKLDAGWEAINASYSQGQPSRNQAQLDVLREELAKEKDAKNIESLKREIKRAEASVKGKNG